VYLNCVIFLFNCFSYGHRGKRPSSVKTSLRYVMLRYVTLLLSTHSHQSCYLHSAVFSPVSCLVVVSINLNSHINLNYPAENIFEFICCCLFCYSDMRFIGQVCRLVIAIKCLYFKFKEAHLGHIIEI